MTDVMAAFLLKYLIASNNCHNTSVLKESRQCMCMYVDSIVTLVTIARHI